MLDELELGLDRWVRVSVLRDALERLDEFPELRTDGSMVVRLVDVVGDVGRVAREDEVDGDALLSIRIGFVLRGVARVVDWLERDEEDLEEL